jgi:tellurite resistance protein TehA-like permease
MATGIVALAAEGAGLSWVAHTLFWLSVALFALLWALLLARCLLHPQGVAADLRDHGAAPGFFTTVAATCIVGSQCVKLYAPVGVALVLWFLGLGLWFALTYGMLPRLMEGEHKPPLTRGLNGGWLLAVVSTQAVSELGSRVAGALPGEAAPAVLFGALAFWLVGGMLYLWLIALIFYRCLFLPLAPGDLAPAYWINMGAMAISTLAGAFLLEQSGQLPLVAELVPFIKGMTLLFWATASWWIPMLLALSAWRYLSKHFPLAYDHGYWAAVFPLGMYTVCTRELMTTFHLSFIAVIPAVFVWVALAAWLATFAGMAWTVTAGRQRHVGGPPAAHRTGE